MYSIADFPLGINIINDQSCIFVWLMRTVFVSDRLVNLKNSNKDNYKINI